MNIEEIVGWLNHSLALEWNDEVAQARDLLQKTGNQKMKLSTKAKCVECSRVFDLLDTNDANEWAYGHDCEDI